MFILWMNINILFNNIFVLNQMETIFCLRRCTGVSNQLLICISTMKTKSWKRILFLDKTFFEFEKWCFFK